MGSIAERPLVVAAEFPRIWRESQHLFLPLPIESGVASRPIGRFVPRLQSCLRYRNRNCIVSPAYSSCWLHSFGEAGLHDLDGVWEHVAFVAVALMFAADGKGLAGRAAGD